MRIILIDTILNWMQTILFAILVVYKKYADCIISKSFLKEWMLNFKNQELKLLLHKKICNFLLAQNAKKNSHIS